jgi:glycosyltransferase involved in cell wall biosynthesis
MRVLINTVPFYGKGAGLRTYTTQLLRALHASNADMEWHIALRAEDAERLDLANDKRFRLTRLSTGARPPSVPGLRFIWWNMLDQVAVPGSCTPKKYDLVHYLDSYGPAFRTTRVPLVLTVHDIIPLTGEGYYAGWMRRYLAYSMRRTIPGAVSLLTVSDATAYALEKMLNIPPERIKVVALGVDERFRPTSERERAAVLQRYGITGPYIINVGTIEPRKNLARLVHAFAQAKRRFNIPHQLLLAGKPKWKADDVTAAIELANLGSAIRLLGFVPDEDIAPMIGAADVLAYPSLEEGFGLPVIEGMACGTPVIASITSPIAETIGNAALLVDPLNIDAIAVALGELCMNPQRRAAMSAEGLARAQQFSWSHVADATIETYRHAAGERQPVLESYRA